MLIECRSQFLVLVLASSEEKESFLQVLHKNPVYLIQYEIYNYPDQLNDITKEKKTIICKEIHYLYVNIVLFNFYSNRTGLHTKFAIMLTFPIKNFILMLNYLENLRSN